MVLCSGKLYYELDDKREKLRAEGKAQDVAIVRMEQVGEAPQILSPCCLPSSLLSPLWHSVLIVTDCESLRWGRRNACPGVNGVK